MGADDNYEKRGLWSFQHISNDYYLIRNVHTKRLLFSTGNVVSGSEKGWAPMSDNKGPAIVGTDNNYYGRAYWKAIKVNGEF